MRPLLAPIALLVSLSACSGIDLLNTTAPREGITTTHNIPYAPGDRHQLDVYAPAHASRAPVAVFFYGGGWTSGSREEYRFVAATLAAQGIVTMVPDYRLYPAVRYPAFIEDGAAAVSWARQHAAQYGGDPERIFLIGHSAGAYIAMMLALDPRWLAPYQIDPRRNIAGVIGISGPYDFLPLDTEELRAIFAPAQPPTLSQPINYVRAPMPPVLLLLGTRDRTVLPQNSYHLAAAIQAAGGSVTLKTYPGLGHELALGAIAPLLGFIAPVRSDVVSFIKP